MAVFAAVIADSQPVFFKLIRSIVADSAGGFPKFRHLLTSTAEDKDSIYSSVLQLEGTTKNEIGKLDSFCWGYNALVADLVALSKGEKI